MCSFEHLTGNQDHYAIADLVPAALVSPELSVEHPGCDGEPDDRRNSAQATVGR
jgi:hypothetical protein